MRLRRKIFLCILVGLVSIQFIQPVKNSSESVSKNDIAHVLVIPPEIHKIVEVACYDCHSNKTHYPWYASVQPIGWYMASHIKKGKSDLNFSEFGAYSNLKQVSKMQSIINSIDDNTMPLKSYRLVHSKADLSKDDKHVLVNWLQNIKDSLSSKNL